MKRFPALGRVGWHGWTSLVGAFLLFQVQLIVAKAILPRFGGAPAVWTTCMLFFQALLLMGYAYAHAATRWLAPRTQAGAQLVLLALALLALPIAPEVSQPGSGAPVARILAHLGRSVAPDGFAWLVPMQRGGQPRMKAGLLMRGDARAHLIEFLGRPYVRARIIGDIGEPIRRLAPVGPTAVGGAASYR